MLGLPGATSFRSFHAVVRRAGELEASTRRLDDDVLARAARDSAPLAGTALAGGVAPQFLATAREMSARRLGLRPHDHQLVAACALLTGHAVELDTGEGKTLAGAVAAVGFVVSGRRVHVVSVNDYLAERDATDMGSLLESFGASVGWVGQRTEHDDRREAWSRDVVYASVSELGFDVLRDRFATRDSERVSPASDVAVVDEVDAVLIDEAMVPLVLAGTSEEAPVDMVETTRLVADLVEHDHFTVDAERANATFTDAGLDQLERELGGVDLYSTSGGAVLTGLTLALHARALMHRDVDYLVDAGAVALIDASRGRVAERRRWPDGLHAAVEAKEGLAVSPAGLVLDSVTVQDLMGRYATLSGMSGTVVPVARELQEFYGGLQSGRVERRVPDARVDADGVVTVTQVEKFDEVVREVLAQHGTGRPVLVGTHSVAESVEVADMLRSRGADPVVLNARNDADEAAIVARAGELGAVTISTQMSGRGTDIVLGGPEGADRRRVVEAGGLYIVLTGRFASRRLDAQLRGRAGRQGDPGGTRTFAALTDDLVTTNVTPRTLALAERHGPRLSAAQRRRIVDSAQVIAEGVRRDRHRTTWAYARAIARQRAVVLDARAAVTGADGAASDTQDLLGTLRARLADHLRGLGVEADGAAVTRTISAVLVLTLDEHWSDHLGYLSEVRDGIHLRALAGGAPLDEFHALALRRFDGFFERVLETAAATVARLDPDQIGGPADQLGLRRPSATWTYLVTDDPYGSHGDRFTRRMGTLWREKVLGDEPETTS